MNYPYTYRCYGEGAKHGVSTESNPDKVLANLRDFHGLNVIEFRIDFSKAYNGNLEGRMTAATELGRDQL